MIKPYVCPVCGDAYDAVTHSPACIHYTDYGIFWTCSDYCAHEFRNDDGFMENVAPNSFNSAEMDC